MSGEWGGYLSLPPRSTIVNKAKNSEVASAAKTALKRLNSLIKESKDWRDDRSELESKVMRLSAALGSAGKSPGELLRPDPVMIRQREEILRLESARDRLEDEVRRLRTSLAESDRAITCSGARRLKEKLRRVRDEEAGLRLGLGEEILRLKASLREAQEESSCAGLNGLRKKLREILNADRKMDRVIADAANNGANAVSDLIEEVERVRTGLGRKERENLVLRTENRSLKSRLDQVGGDKRIVEAEEKVLRLVKCVEELEGEVDERRKEFQAQEIRLTQIRNELIGAKIAFRVKSGEVEELRDAKKELDDLRKIEKERDELQRRLEAAASVANEVQRLREEIGTEKNRTIHLEIERDGLAEEIVKVEGIVSERNEQIVKMLADNERLKSRCEKLEDDLLKLDGKIRACSAGDSNEFQKINDALKVQVNSLQGSKVYLENELVAFRGRIEALKSELETERAGRNEVEKMARDTRSENELLKSEAQRLVEGFVLQLEKLKTEKKELEVEVQELETKSLEFTSTSEELQKLKNKLEKLRKTDELRISNKASKSTETWNEIFRSESDYMNLKDELSRAKDEAQKALRDLSFLSSENKELRKEIKQLEKVKETDKASRTREKSDAMEDGDYVRADRELKYYIHLQSLAVKRVLDFIRYVVGDDEGVRPAMATFLEPTLTNVKVLKMDENMTTTFRMSQKLSERIFEAEVDVQKLEKLKNERIFLREEHTFDNHLSVSNFFMEAEEDGDDKILEMNRRISTLQDQIKSKQYEAEKRLIEMRETMRQERIHLMEIADGRNVQYLKESL